MVQTRCSKKPPPQPFSTGRDGSIGVGQSATEEICAAKFGAFFADKMVQLSDTPRAGAPGPDPHFIFHVPLLSTPLSQTVFFTSQE